jgi:guanine deaminase
MDGLLGFGGIDSDSEAEMDNPVEEEKDVKPRIDDGIQDDAVDIFGWENWEERLVKWVFNGDDRNTLGVWVAGREVYKKGGIPPTWPLDRSD